MFRVHISGSALELDQAALEHHLTELSTAKKNGRWLQGLLLVDSKETLSLLKELGPQLKTLGNNQLLSLYKTCTKRFCKS